MGVRRTRMAALAVPLFVVTGALGVPSDPATATASNVAGALAGDQSGRASAQDAKVPVYRDPPTYQGLKRSPHTVPVAPRTTPPLSTAGENPHVYVDEAGTAHIVWNERRGDAADVAVYCRLPRGATECASRAELEWVKPYGDGDAEYLNVDNQGPRILRLGEQLVVLSTRFPTYGEKPSGRGDTTTLAWTSLDGGVKWSPPAVIGSNRFDDVDVVGPPDNPRILAFGASPLCTYRDGEPASAGCLVAHAPGEFKSGAGSLSSPGGEYVTTLDAYGGEVLAAMSNAGGEVWVRRWNGAEPLDSGSTWSLSASMAGSEPVLAVGPGGSYLMTRGGVENPVLGEIRVRRLTTEPDGVVAESAPVIVSEGGRIGDLMEDPSGRLHGVWIENDGVTYRSAEPGSLAFSPAQVLVPGLDNGQWRVGAASDGGGFAVLNHAGGQIIASAFGTPTPTGKPGIAGIPGGGNVGCTTVDFGAFNLEASGGCFLQGTGSLGKGLVLTSKEVELNGLVIEPEAGSRLAFDPQALTIDTVSAVEGSKDPGTARVLLRQAGAEVELFRGRLTQNLKNLKPGSTLFTFTPDLDRTNMLGFPVASNLPVKLTETGVEVPLEVKLPSAFGAFTGRATLVGERGLGLRLTSLHVRIGPVPLGALVVKRIEIDWAEGGTWRGLGELVVPAAGTLEVEVAFVAGTFQSARAVYTPNPPIPLGPKVYLTQVTGGLSLEPTTLTASASVGVPIPYAPPIVGTGTFTMTFPKTGPGTFKLGAVVQIYGITVADGYVRFDTDGYAAFGGSGELTLGPVSGSLSMEGFVDANSGQWGADARVGGRFCRTIRSESPPREECTTTDAARMVLSSLGFALCAGPIKYASDWEAFNPADIVLGIFSGCQADEYYLPPPRAYSARGAGRAASGFALPSGLPSATIAVTGIGGQPDVLVRGPDGSVVAAQGSAADGVEMFSVPGVNAVYVGLDSPRGGTYSVEPVAGSVPVGQVLVSRGVRSPKVAGSVRRDGRRVTIHYRASRVGPQHVILRERSKAGTRLLGPLKPGHGVKRIKVAGPRGRRTLEAVVLLRGVSVQVHRLGHYQAQGPGKPGRVRTSARLRGSTVLVRVRSPRGAQLTIVTVVGSEGARLTRVLDKHSARIKLRGFKWDRRVSVRVRAVDEQGRPGPVTRRVVRRR